ncbi:MULTISPECIES: hypothetical protein [unclassified Fusibacter]|uniref:hypothetical protein n=1 Tax=unclassified Fusibacter TaxID=2624464 RepID=UPI0010135CDF|nr:MULTISPECIES: hypothetical protein [unclassified Fusibacter]MCK8061701.1 hypothetical protein [Fusibacter sp. A2]NPE23870.1 hypothetical protein [Fusibacter sp. A1]RXV58545.1 hypothetical protein DWB64_18965 [Fusibacter sp. A1]
MSLTTLLQRPEVKAKFKEEFIKPRFKYNKELLAEPLTNNYSVIGVAFDYLARFHIEKVNSHHNVKSRQWIAETYVERSCLLPWKEDAYNMIIEEVKYAKEEFMVEGIVDEFLIKPLIKMSRIDMIHRSAQNDIDVFAEVDSKDIEDIQNLYNVFKQQDWVAKDVCYLNPVFGEASLMVGGADADLIFNDVLIDFKTIKKAGMTRTSFDQLMGYYLLNEIGGITEKGKIQTINSVAIYSSRYGEIMKIDIEDIFDTNRLPELKSWMKEVSKKK